MGRIGGAGNDTFAYDPAWRQHTNIRYIFSLQGDDYLYSLYPSAASFYGGGGIATAVGGPEPDTYQWSNNGSFEVLVPRIQILLQF